MAKTILEHGQWDSFWGYICTNCGIGYGRIEEGIEHDNQHCDGTRPIDEETGKRIMWKG